MNALPAPPLVTAAEVRDFVMACAQPGLAGLRACANAVVYLPKPVWRELLSLMHRANPNPAEWQLALVAAWAISSTTVVASTEGDEGLLRAAAPRGKRGSMACCPHVRL